MRAQRATLVVWISVFASFALLLLATGCLGGAGGPEAVATLPEDELREAGTLTVCTDPTRPPLEYRSRDGVLRGFEVELMEEIADRLGLGVTWVDRRRDELADALSRRQCDVVASTLAVRRDGSGELSRVAASAYLAVPVSLLVRRGERGLALTGLCGRRVAALAGTRELDLLGELGEGCADEGRGAVEAVATTGTPESLAALGTGRVDAVLAEHPVNAWLAQRRTDAFDLASILGEELARWAIGTDRDRVGVYDAVRVSLRELHEDGTFGELLDRWGLDRTGAIRLPTT